MQAGVEESVQILQGIQTAQEVSRGLEAGLGGLIGAGMGTDVVEALQPIGQSPIQILEALGGLSGLADLRFKILLNGAKKAFDFALAPSVVGLGVEEADLEVGADQAGVIVGEGTTLVGVEFARATAAFQRLFEGEVKGAGIGLEVVEGGDDEPGMIVDNGAEVGAGGLTLAGHRGTGGEVGHPEVVDGGGFEGLGGPGDGLTELITTGALVEVVGLQTTVNRAEGGQGGIVFEPLAVEDFDGDAGAGPDAGQEALALFGGKHAGLAAITAGLGMEGREAAAAEGIPPVLQRAHGHDELQAVGALDRSARDRFQGRAQRQTLVNEVLDFGNEGETRQGQGLGGVHRSIIGHRAHPARSPKRGEKMVVWDRYDSGRWCAASLIIPDAGSDNRPAGWSCGIGLERASYR